MNIVFMGTPDFAVQSLRAIHAQFPVSGVVTVPDKPKGRGLAVHPSAVKAAALELGIPTILQPESLKDADFINALAALKPDIIAVVAFRILPREVYTLARLGAFNIHGSLLPKYRGAAPINWAIINGDAVSGVTSFLLADSVDTGAMLGMRTTPIPDGMTAGELHDALMSLGAELAVETCSMLASGNVTPLPQNDAEATKAPKIFRETCKIDWTKPAKPLRNFIHGLSPYPGAWTTMPDGTTLKIMRCAYTLDSTLHTGEYAIHGTEWRVGCGEGELHLLEIQPEGKRIMLASAYVRGFRGEQQGQFRS
jgi:methionyl-tRNA formyltransferase